MSVIVKQFIEDLKLDGRRVLTRVDFNVPLNDELKITDNGRIKGALPTIKHITQQGGKAVLMSHLGRPIEGQFDRDFSLEPVANRLESELGKDVCLIKNWRD